MTKVLKLNNQNRMLLSNNISLYQSPNFDLIYPRDYYLFCLEKNSLLFYKNKIGWFTNMVVEFPDNNQRIIREFIKYCKKNFWGYTLKSYFLYPELSYKKSHTFIFDVEKDKILKKQKANIKKAKKKNVTTKRLCEKSEWKEFANLHQKILHSPKDTKSLIIRNFDKLYEANEKSTILFGAYLKNHLIGGILLYKYNETLLYSLSVADPSYVKLGTTPLLLHSIIKYCKKHSIKYLDLNVGSPLTYVKKGSKIDAINKFKSRWGGNKTVYFYRPKIVNLFYTFFKHVTGFYFFRAR